MPNLGAVRRERFLTIDNPPGVGWVKFLIFLKVRVSIHTCVPNLGAVRHELFLTIDNPLNPPGVGPHMCANFGRGPSRKIFNNR